MMEYAREDTHYLLYIYDRLRIELLENGSKHNAANPLSLLKSCYMKSAELCVRVYEKPKAKDMNYYQIVAKTNVKSMNQVRLTKLLLKLRDFWGR